MLGGIAFAAMAAFGLVLLAAAIAFAGVGVCLLIRTSPYGLIPAMPYWVAVILGLALLALCVLTAAGCIWYSAFLRQAARVFARFQKNTLASATAQRRCPFSPGCCPARPGRCAIQPEPR